MLDFSKKHSKLDNKMNLRCKFSQNQLPKTLHIRVTPNASFNRIKEMMFADGSIKLCVHLSTPAQDGQANKALIKLLAKELKIAIRAIKIISGVKHRDKILEIITS